LGFNPEVPSQTELMVNTGDLQKNRNCNNFDDFEKHMENSWIFHIPWKLLPDFLSKWWDESFG